MGKREIYHSYKERKHTRVDNGRRNDAILQSKVANDVKRNASSGNVLGNKNDFDNGLAWFNNGLTLDDASNDMKNNPSFIAGFKKGERLVVINQSLYEEGKKYFEQGLPLESAPKNYKDNEYFILGYNESMIRKK